MARRTPYEVAVEARRVARRRLKDWERRAEKAHAEAESADRQLARARSLAELAENHPDLGGGTAPSTEAHLEGHGTQLRSDETGQISSETGGDNAQEAATTDAGDAADDANSAASMPEQDADSESVDPWASETGTPDES